MTDTNNGVDLLALIEDDTRRVSYRPSWNQFTGSVNATLFLQQMIYWWVKQGRRPFYKFNSPCDHPQYRTGDSWQEELGMTRSEFETARRKIGAKTKGNVNGKALVSYWIDPERRTWYALNETAVIAELQAIYPNKEEETAVGVQSELMQESSISPDPDADPNVGIPHYVMQESSISQCRNPALELMQESCNRTTTETTREEPKDEPDQPPPPDHEEPRDVGDGGGGGLKRILQKAGIKEPKLTMLLNLPHITPEYAKAHLARAPSIGAAIHRMENKWEMPEPKQPRNHIPPELEDIIKR